MATLITVRGRVESDPMRIPTPARSPDDANESFESILQQAREPEPTPPVDAEPEADAAPGEPEIVEDQAAEAPPEGHGTPVGEPPANPAFASSPAQQAAAPTADTSDTLRRGETERQATAGKGTASPRTSSAEPLLAAVVQRTAQSTEGRLVQVNGVVTPSATTTATAAEPRGLGGIATTAAARANGAVSASAIAGGYRTSAKTSAELLDHARDSVFKQILMKLTDGGGEMRVRLEPPELGELDLHLLVEQGNQVNLRIAADRPEVAELLQRHLPALQHALQASGLEITGAHVETRSERDANSGGQQRRDGAAPYGNDTNDHDLDVASTPPQRGGWIRADGLDFWA